MEHDDEKKGLTDSDEELAEQENNIAALERQQEPEQDSRLDRSQISEQNSAADESNSVASSKSQSFEDLTKYIRGRQREVSSEKQPRRKSRKSKPKSPPERSEQAYTKPKPEKSKPKKKQAKTSRKKNNEPTEAQRLIAQQQCKLCFNRLVNPMSDDKVIDQITLRNALQKFNGQCDLQKLTPLMNFADHSRTPPLQTLTYQQFQQIFMKVQSHH